MRRYQCRKTFALPAVLLTQVVWLAVLFIWEADFRHVAAAPPSGGAVQLKQISVSAGGRSHAVRLIRVKLDRVRVKVGLAEGRVGHTEELDGIARRYHAIAAINGCFFDAYTSHPIKNPEHTLITGGQVAHLGNVGTLLGFTSTNDARMERVALTIEGSREGSFKWPHRWYAYWLNRFTTSGTITLFTPHWGSTTGFRGGTQVMVSHKQVINIGRGPQLIPSDGYVIYWTGVSDSTLSGFKVGQEIGFRVVRKDGGDMSFWGRVQEGIACGPRLVTNGRITLDPVSEGFSSPKILSQSGARSAVGMTRDGWLLLVTTSGAVRDLAGVMKSLGAEQAMNLDGGASSGLWLRGQYLTRPGRKISNALCVLER